MRSREAYVREGSIEGETRCAVSWLALFSVSIWFMVFVFGPALFFFVCQRVWKIGSMKRRAYPQERWGSPRNHESAR